MKTPAPILAGAGAVLFILLTAAAATAEEVRPGIQILNGVNANLPNDDLKPLKRVIGEAPVVALGESFHTSRGFARLKYRVFRYLVEEMGFRALAIESEWVPAEIVAEYVRTCEGSPEERLINLHPAWQSRTVRDVVKWMCVWNHRHPNDRVHFFGFDMKQPDPDSAGLKAYLERIGLTSDDPRVQGIERCSQKVSDWWERDYTEEDYRECVKRLTQISNFFDRREAKLGRQTSPEELGWARVHLVGLRTWQDHYFYYQHDYEPEGCNPVSRDAALGHLFAAIRELRFPGGIKTVIWTANSHADKYATGTFGCPAMGSYLADAFGDDYVALAFTAYEVEVNWPGYGCGSPDVQHSDDSVEELLYAFGEPYLFVDLDFRGSGNPFLEPGGTYHMGRTGWNREAYDGAYMVPRDHFDGFFFLEHSPPMAALFWDECSMGSTN
ncbi:MAG: erythromycin esterase family protein [bacterium]|nr:erythromycin esterase family protein [bacterium]